MTPTQIQTLQIARRQVGLTDDAGYRLLLRNVAGVASCKALSNQQFEDCMAILEERGYRYRDQPSDYWRKKVAARGGTAGERRCALIRDLALRSGYALGGLCARHSEGRAQRPEDLTPREGGALIEALKAIIARAARTAGTRRTTELPKTETFSCAAYSATTADIPF